MSWLLEINILVPFFVLQHVDAHLYRVVTGCTGGQIPLNLGDLALLLLVADRDEEQEADQRASAHGEGKAVVSP